MIEDNKVRIFYISIFIFFILFFCLDVILFTRTLRYERIYDSISIGMDEDEVARIFGRNFQIESPNQGMIYYYYLNLGCDTDFQDFIKVRFEDGIVIEKEAIVFGDPSFFDKSVKERYSSGIYFLQIGLFLLFILLFYIRNKLLNKKEKYLFLKRVLLTFCNIVLLVDLIILVLLFIFNFLDLVCILLA